MKNKNNSNNKNNNDNDDTGESAGNKTQNARLERHYVYDERRDDNSKMKDLGTFLYFMLCHLIASWTNFDFKIINNIEYSRKLLLHSCSVPGSQLTIILLKYSTNYLHARLITSMR